MTAPIVFIGMECSGQVRRALWARGIYTISADLKQAEDGGQYPQPLGGHIQDDVFTVLRYLQARQMWPAAALFHPDCTYLTNSAAWAYKDGPYHQQVRPGTLVGAARRKAREQQLELVQRLVALPIPHRVLENPAQGALTARIGAPDQVVQPYMFGSDASKATGLWLAGVPLLAIPPRTAWVPPRWVNGRPRWHNQTDSGQNRLSPSSTRAADRSRTYPGIAAALADAIARSMRA